MESASTGLDGARQELDRLDRQGLDNGLDSGSTEPRQLDSSTARAQRIRSSMWYSRVGLLRTSPRSLKHLVARWNLVRKSERQNAIVD